MEELEDVAQRGFRLHKGSSVQVLFAGQGNVQCLYTVFVLECPSQVPGKYGECFFRPAELTMQYRAIVVDSVSEEGVFTEYSL